MIKIIISGGGTGGHVFPAIAIANALKALRSDLDILFIGAKGRMEMEKVPAAGYNIEGLTISGFQRRLTWKNLTFPIKLMASMMQARSILKKFHPHVVIGVGGYASGPILRVATAHHIPTLIQEQNSFPGVTNRLLGARVDRICVAYDGMQKFFPKDKLVVTGNPIRQDLVNLPGKDKEAYSHFGLTPGKKVVLVIGGSLGAGTINQAILAFLDNGFDPDTMQLIWQTGKNYFDSIQSKIVHRNSEIVNRRPAGQAGNSNIGTVLPFIDRMDLAYAAADLVVSRAGAIAISELCAVAKPVILIPSPNVAEDHQTKNARTLADKKAAVLVRDADALEKLGAVISDLLNNESLSEEIKKNIAPLAKTDAAFHIAQEALNLIPGLNPDERRNHES